MKYKFEIHKLDIDKYPYFFIRIENEVYYPVGRFSDSGWIPQKVQDIIDGVEIGKTKSKEDAYEWANEDVFLVSNEHGVFLWDLLAERTGKEQDSEKLSLRLTHEEFLTFLQDFKKFLEENL